MRLSSLCIASITLCGSSLAAQSSAVPKAAPARPVGLDVGTTAPDFTLPGATRYGVLRSPVTLSSYRGKPVVIAFFPKARTSGCTKQLETYRDLYSTLFRGGRGVTLIAISADADTTLASWAHDAEFPMVLASDTAGVAGRAYGAFNEGPKMDSRYLYVVDASGKITYVDKPFNVSDPGAYTRMQGAIDAVRVNDSGAMAR